MPTLKEFEDELNAAIIAGLAYIASKTRKEKLYAFGVYTSDETFYSYVQLSANTESGLAAKAQQYAERDPAYGGSEGLKALRWSVPDWHYHCFAPLGESIELPSVEDVSQSRKVYNIFVRCLKRARTSAEMNSLAAPPVLVIACGDMSDRFFLKGLKLLNSDKVVTEFIRDFTPQPYLRWLGKQPRMQRLTNTMQLYHDLNLGIASELALDAQSRNLQAYDLIPEIMKLGAQAAEHLLEIIRRYALVPALNEKGSPEYEKHGAWTLESKLATSSTNLLGEFPKVDEGTIVQFEAAPV